MLHINSTDAQVSYFGAWAIGNSVQNIPYTSTVSVGAGFFLLFRGTYQIVSFSTSYLTRVPACPQVPAQAITVDDSTQDIIIHQSNWSYAPTVWAYAGSQLSTSKPGNSLSYAFDGVAIWYDSVSIITI